MEVLLEFWKMKQLWKIKRTIVRPMIKTANMLKTANLFEKKPNKVYDHHEDTKLLQDINSIRRKMYLKKH